jgi:hypothetical protein
MNLTGGRFGRPSSVDDLASPLSAGSLRDRLDLPAGVSTQPRLRRLVDRRGSRIPKPLNRCDGICVISTST